MCFADIPKWVAPEKMDAIYGACVGGLIAFVTAFFANRHALKRQKLELTFQMDEKRKERQHSLKREVYLPLVVAANEAVAFVTQLPTVPFERIRNDNPMNELARQIARLNLIAPPEVMKPVSEGHTLLMKCYMALTAERFAIHKIDLEVGGIDSAIENWRTQQRAAIQRLERHFDQSTGEPAVRKFLIEEVGKAEQQMLALCEKKGHLVKTRFEMELHLMRKALQEVKPMRAHASKALLAIRSDVGMPVDTGQWQAIAEGSALEVDAALERYMAEVEKKTRETFFPAAQESNVEKGGQSPTKTST